MAGNTKAIQSAFKGRESEVIATVTTRNGVADITGAIVIGALQGGDEAIEYLTKESAEFEQSMMAVAGKLMEVVKACAAKDATIERLKGIVEIAKEMRIYCLGQDCSTKNLITRWDAALEEENDG